MIEPSTAPRTDPRLLVLRLDGPVVHYAALDAWEARAVGHLPTERRAASLGLWRLFARVRPSHVLIVRATPYRPQRLARHVRELAVRRGLPFATCDRVEARALAARAPALPDLFTAYPELRHLIRGTRDPSLVVVRIAIGALETRSLPPRRYVPTISPYPASRLDR